MDLKQYLTKRNLIIGGVSTLAIVGIVASFYVPGMLFQGSLPTKQLTQTSTPTQTVTQISPSAIKTIEFPLSAKCTVSPNPAKIGESVTWTATALGGAGNYKYKWLGSTPIEGHMTQTVTTTYNKVDSYNGAVNVYSGNDLVTANCDPLIVKLLGEQQVNLQPSSISSASSIIDSSGPLKVSCSVDGNKTEVDVGESLTYRVTATGGGGGYVYTWFGALSGYTTNLVNVKFPKAGVKNDVEVMVAAVNDQLKVDCPDVTVLAVLPLPQNVEPTSKIVIPGSQLGSSAGTLLSPNTSLPGSSATFDPGYSGIQIKKPTVSCSASPAAVYPGDTVVWSAAVDKIDENDVTSYTWGGDVSGSARDISAKYSSDGVKNATVEITYAGGTSASKPCTLKVNPDPAADATDDSAADATDDPAADSTADSTTDSTDDPADDSAADATDDPAADATDAMADESIKSDLGTSSSTSNSSTSNTQAVELEMSKCSGVYYPKDIQGHWAELLIKDAYDQCWVRGYADNTFRSNSAITRAEATKIVMVGAGLQPNLGCYDADCGSPFVDLDMWQGAWIRPAYDQGVVEGYTDVSFAPNRLMTRAESSALVTRAFGLQPFVGCYTANCGAGHPNNMFVDIYDFWQGPYIRALWDAGIVQGTAPNRFEPNRPISRAELLKMAYSAAEL